MSPILLSWRLPELSLVCRAVFRNGTSLRGVPPGRFAYVWTKNDIYLNESLNSIQPEKVSEWTTFTHSNESSQGHYRCGIKSLPSGKTVWSDVVTVVLEDYLTFRVATALPLDKTPGPIQFVGSDFVAFARTMDELVKTDYRVSSWSYSTASLNDSVFEVSVFLYIRRNESAEFWRKGTLELLEADPLDGSSFVQAWRSQYRFANVYDVVYCYTLDPYSGKTYTRNYVGAEPTNPMCLTDALKLIPRKCNVNFTSEATWEESDISCRNPNSSSERNPPTAYPPTVCPQDGKSCVFDVHVPLTWSNAKDTCSRWHGYLTENKEESTFKGQRWTGLAKKNGVLYSGILGFSEILHRERRSEVVSIDVDKQTPERSDTCVIKTSRQEDILEESPFVEKKKKFDEEYLAERDNVGVVLSEASCETPHEFSCTFPYQGGLRVPSKCPKGGWLDLDRGNICLWINNTKVRFEEAGLSCMKQGGQLATFKGNYSYHTITAVLIGDDGVLREYDTYWIGLRRPSVGKYEWIDGDPVPTSNWHPRTDYKQTAGQLRLNRYFIHQPLDLKWSLGNPSRKFPFICEAPLRAGNSRLQVRRFDVGESITTTPSINLSCKTSPEILPGTVLWYKDGLPVWGDRTNNSGNDISLNLSATNQDSPYLQGYYWCEGISVVGFRRVESKKALLKFPGVKTYICSIMQMNSTDSVVNYYDTAFSLRDTLLLKIERDINDYVIYEIKVQKIVVNTNSTWTIRFMAFLKPPRRVPKSVDDTEEKTTVELLARALNNISSSEVLPQSATVLSTVVCFSEKTEHSLGLYRTLTWPTTPVGSITTSNETCIDDDGRPVVRRCEGNFTVGAYWGNVEGVCVQAPSQYTLDLKALSTETISRENVLSTAAQLEVLTSQMGSLGSLDVIYVATTLGNIASTGPVDVQVAQNVVAALDNVVNARSAVLRLSRSANSTNRMLNVMEDISAQVEGDKVVFRGSVALGKTRLESTQGIAINLEFEDVYSFLDPLHLTRGTDAAIIFPNELNTSQVGDISVGLIRANSLLQSLSDEGHDEMVSEVCSPILQVGYEGSDTRDLQQPIRLYFRTSCDNVVPVEIVCMYWDVNENRDLGSWVPYGCEYMGNVQEYHVCNCTHLTSFAILFRHTDTQRLRNAHDYILSYITLIGIFLSALGLLMVILTYLLVKKWRKGVGHKILLHLSVALLGSLVAFVTLLTLPKARAGLAVCACIGGVLHYLVLVTFAWTFVEALLQYLRFVKVLGTYIPRFVLKAAIGAWGIPLVIVATLLVLKPGYYYGREQFCWLDGNALLYAFLVPVGIILLANSVVFGIVIFGIYGRTQKGLRTSQSQMALAKAQLRATICIVFLLGLTWVFAYLVILEGVSPGFSRLFEYLFVASSSIQGFVIFIFHIAHEKTAREFWLGDIFYRMLPSKRKRSFDQNSSKNTLSSAGQKTTST